jgi:HK97 family phage portal protein
LNPLRWFVKDQAEEYGIGDDNVLRAFYGALAAVSSSGIRVTQESSLRSTAVLACLIVRAESFSSLPLDVLYKRGRYRIPDEQSAVYSLLAIAPNEMMNAGEFWRWKQLTEDVAGNAYARIVWGKGFTPAEIWPLYGAKPQLVPNRTTHSAYYQYTGDDFSPADAYPLRDILHFKGPVLRSPWEGRSLIDLISESIGVAVGSEQFFARLLGNGNHFPGYLETDSTLSDPDFAAISEQMKGFAGIFRAGELRVFDRGLKYKQNPLTMKDAQLVEQLRWQLQQICSVTRVPMAMVQDLTNGTYSNSEQQDLALGKHCITPICINTERVVRHKLFAKSPDYYIKFNLDGLLRGDYKTRTEGEATLVRAGIIARNEARSQEDMNPMPGLDVPLAELNLGTVDKDGVIHGPDTGASAPDAPAPAPAALLQSVSHASLFEPVLRDAAERIRIHAAGSSKNENGRRRTEQFARVALAPVIDAYALAGEPFDVAAFIQDAMAQADEPAPGEPTLGD